MKKSIQLLLLTFCISISCSASVYLDEVKKLSDHISGNAVMSDSDLLNNQHLIVQHIGDLSTDVQAISKSFDLIALFDQKFGALFTTTNTQNGFNRANATDGLNLHRNIILIHQGLIDHSYTEGWLQNSQNILNGKLFQTANYFPGFVAPPQNANTIETAKIKCSYVLGKGSQPNTIGNTNVIRPTGCYVAPGSIAEITVPNALIGKGIMIRVGAHYWDYKDKGTYKRLDRVSINYDINQTVIKVANPLGGGIYLEVPLGVSEGIVDIQLKNVVRSPFYSKKTFHNTSMADWLNVERKHAAPWTDFETDKYMIQVPTSWIYNYDDPQTFVEEWDKAMDAVSNLLGRPQITDKHKFYAQVDLSLRGVAYHPGYPMGNDTYNPNEATNGLPKGGLMTSPDNRHDILFHEMGHEVGITKFVGEQEAIVNFLYVAVLQNCYNYSLDDAFEHSFGPSYGTFQKKDNTVQTRLVSNTFHLGQERNTCGCNHNEVQYQHRGYAHYVDIVELFGWEALEKFWKSEGDAADNGNPFPVNNQNQDVRIYRMSLAAGVDLRPLFHFWGIHPHNQTALAQLMKNSNLALSASIKSKLCEYNDLIPADYNEFIAFGEEQHADFMNYSGSNFDYGAGWYKQRAQNYNTSSATAIDKALKDIMVYYYGSVCGTDCNNEIGGSAIIDVCGVCTGGNTGIVASSNCKIDCNGDANGTAYLDDCEICVGGNTGKSKTINGIPDGYVFLGNEGDTKPLPSQSDVVYGASCNFAYVYGVSGSIAINNGTFGDPAPGYPKKAYYKPVNLADCNGVAGGSAYLDSCNTCAGGNTGNTDCLAVVTSIGDEATVSALNIYPNPVQNQVNIDGEFSNWTLTDSKGAFIKAGTEKVIDVGGLNSGLYYLNVDGEVLKFIKI